jgi:hypothetical protein
MLSRKYNFQSLVISTGSYVNEDEQLAMYYATGGLQQVRTSSPPVPFICFKFRWQMFREVRPGLPELSDHEIMGIAKSIAMCVFFWVFFALTTQGLIEMQTRADPKQPARRGCTR